MTNPTALASYLEKKKIPVAAFAEKVRAHRSQIYRCLRGERGPGVELAVRIERETAGAVPVAAWTSETQPRRRGKAI